MAEITSLMKDIKGILDNKNHQTFNGVSYGLRKR